MEKDSNNSDMNRLGLSTSGEMFFYQRWGELLHNFTLDTYQVNILSPRAVLSELVSVIDDIQTFGMHEHNLRDVIREALRRTDDDPVLEARLPAKTVALKRRLQATERTARDSASQVSLRYYVKAFLDWVQPSYLEWACEALGSSIAEGNLPRIDRLAGIVASEALATGWSQRALYERKHHFRARPPTIAWASFSEHLLKPQQQYICLTPLPTGLDLRAQGSLARVGLVLRDGAVLAAEYPDIAIPHAAEESTFAVESVTACDLYSAALLAFRKVTSLVSFLVFYDLVSLPVNIPTVVVLDLVRTKAKRVTIAEIMDPQYRVDPTLRVWEPTEKVWLSPGLTDVVSRLEGVFTSSALGKQAASQEIRFINLWSAMESLLRLKTTSTDIRRLKELVGAIHSIRYLSRLIRNFGEDCHRCNVQIEGVNGRIVAGGSRSSRTLEIAEVLLDPGASAKLKAACSINELLSYRVSALTELVSDPAKCQATLTAHNEKVMWHVQRLYRMRNAIVHSAYSSEKSLSLYLRNLHGYLSILTAELIPYIADHQANDMEEAIQLLLGNYSTVIELFRRGTKSASVLVGNVPEFA